MLALTSSAVMVWPLWNLTPWRSLKSMVLSSTTLQDVASPGTILPSKSRSTSESKRFMRTEMPTNWLAKNGWGLSISLSVSMRSVPLRCDAVAGAGVGAAALAAVGLAAAVGALVGAAAGADVGLAAAVGAVVAAADAVGAV